MSKRKALMTLVFDGGPIFEVWYKYYTQFFAEEDIYVLTHESPPKMFEGKNCNLLALPHSMCQGGKADVENLATINNLQHCLFNGTNSSASEELRCGYRTESEVAVGANSGYQGYEHKPYSCVTYADFDEIIYHPLGLDYIIDTFEEDFLTCTGYEIVQKRQEPDAEADLDWTRPILEQRSYWYRWGVYDKPLILQRKFDWECGLHALRGPLLKCWMNKDIKIPNQLENLYLLHLHKVDWNNTKAMHKKYVGPESPKGFDIWWRHAETRSVRIPQALKNSLPI